MDVIISLDDLYEGSTSRVPYDETKGIYADFAQRTNRIVRFVFMSRGGWDKKAARKWLKNKGLDKVYLRKNDDGSMFINHISLSVPISQIECSDDSSEIESAFGKESYKNILSIENRHNSDKPMVVKVIAMDFQGKDFVVANGIKFYRDQIKKSINKFSGINIRLGHPGFFEDYSKRIGNTIASYIDKDGNPVTLSYIHPHAEAGEFREDLRIANAQNNLESFEVSMFGEWGILIMFNPVAPILEGLTAAAIDHRSPDLVWTAYSAVCAMAILFASLAVFRRLEPSFAEYV